MYPSISHMSRAALLAVLLIGCGATSDKESRYWEANKAAVKTHTARWPGFSPVLNDLQNRAEQAWTTAAEMKDPQARAERMKEINRFLSRLVGRLNEVEKKIETVKTSVSDLKGLSLAKELKAEQRNAILAGRTALEEVEQALGATKPTHQDGALAALELVISKLIAVQTDLKRTTQQLEKAQRKK